MCTWLTIKLKENDAEYKYVPTFRFPKNEALRSEWKRKIPRDNLFVTHNSKVCMKHFEEKVLWKYDVFPCSNGCIHCCNCYFCPQVLDDMTVYVFINGDKLPDSAFRWYLSISLSLSHTFKW